MKNYNPKYAFYYLLSLVSLIFMSIFLAVIVFHIIDKSIYDTLSEINSYTNQSLLRFAISALLISSPVFFICANIINKGLKKGDLEKDAPLRNWLTYFILAVSAVVILGSIVGVINDFLSGEMTLKSVFQLLTVILIASLVFSFYLYDIKREQILKKDNIIKVFFFSSLTLVVAIFVSAWFFVDSPQVARERKFDNILLNNIYSIESYVNNYYDENESLPESLSVLKDSLTANNFEARVFVDPLTSQEIEYKKTGDKAFELCANFRTDSYESERNRSYPVYMYDGAKIYVKGWNCFKGNLWNDIKGIEKK